MFRKKKGITLWHTLELKNANVIVHICVFRACCHGQLAANDKIPNGAVCDNGELQQQERWPPKRLNKNRKLAALHDGTLLSNPRILKAFLLTNIRDIESDRCSSSLVVY